MSRRIYPVDVKPASRISNWGLWPDDVEPLLRIWNRGANGGLSFRRIGVFKCWDCDRFCHSHTYGAAVHRKEPVCDDCLIARARARLVSLSKMFTKDEL